MANDVTAARPLPEGMETTAPDEFEPPSYREPGRMLVEVEEVYRGPANGLNRYSAVLHDYDGSAFWINEGVGIEYWLDAYTEIPDEGWYVFEGVIGDYIRGDGWTTDDDEEWDFAYCRRATAAEIASAALAKEEGGE